MNNLQRQVKEFHEKHGVLVRDTPGLLSATELLLRIELLTSEVAEFVTAAANRNLTEMVDALADILYVTYGTALTLGVDMEEIMDEVHRSNMTKEVGKKDVSGKVPKGVGFEAPRIAELLSRQMRS